MNESHNRLISEKNKGEVSQRAPTANTIKIEDGPAQSSTYKTQYESFFWLFNYTKMFTTRMAKDIFISMLQYAFSDRVLPNHIVDLKNVQKCLRAERELHTATYSSEDDFGLQCPTSPKGYTEIVHSVVEKEPMFVIVDSSSCSCVNNPSSKEPLIHSKTNPKDTILNKYYNQKIPGDLPSTSKDHVNIVLPPQLKESDRSDSIDELQMIGINLQSDEDLSLGADIENDNVSIVVSYIRNKDIIKEIEELSETSLEACIPSYPGSPRSLNLGSAGSLEPQGGSYIDMRAITNYFHQDNDFLVAAEIGDVNLLEILIRKGRNIQELDYLGRNALHLAICSGNEEAIILLLNAGVDTNVKDNVGATPLSLCLLRSPSLRVASLLFEHGARIAPRQIPMDTGLFLQVVMACIPTPEEEKILRLLVQKGALINDPEAPGGRQALHFAAMSDNCRLIKILIDLGADLFAKNHRNETPKEVAMTFGCSQAYLLLDELERCLSNTAIVAPAHEPTTSDAANAAASASVARR